MFQGTIPGDARAILQEHTASWTSPEVGVACCGNFTIERVLHATPHLAGRPIHSCDVSLYTSAVGSWLAGGSLSVDVSPEYEAEYGWMREYLGSPIETAATMALATRLAPMVTHTGSYFERMREAYIAAWPELHTKTIERFEKVALRLASYTPADAVDWVANLSKDVALMSFPPFEAKGYDQLWKHMQALFTWDQPAFEPLNEARAKEFIGHLTDRRDWAFGSNHRWPEYEDRLRGLTWTTSRAQSIWVYASSDKTRLVFPRQETQPLANPRLMPGDTLGDTLTIAELTLPQFNAMRSLYMNPGIRPGAMRGRFAVLVDDKIIGCFGVERPQGSAGIPAGCPRPHIFLLSDFAVAPSDEPKLSKLVVYAALSTEAHQLYQRLLNRRIRGISTTVYSDRPTSMKYRGLLKVLSREEQKPEKLMKQIGAPMLGAADFKRYKIVYGGPVARWTLAEGFAEWRKKR